MSPILREHDSTHREVWDMRRNTLVYHTKQVLFVALSTAFMAGCNFDLSEIFGSELQKISLSGPDIVSVGDTVRLTASGTVTGVVGLLFVDPIRDDRFGVSDPTVVMITPFNPPSGDTTSFASVNVKGLKVGTAQVTVTARGKSATHSVQVVPPT
jgi:hypothetical protein